jgi:N-acetylglucosamine-6-phosphate deacetylase
MKIIDIHTHGIGGYDTRVSTSEAILKMAEIHGARGVDVIIPTIYSAPVHIMRENMTAVKKAMEQQKRVWSGERGVGSRSPTYMGNQPVVSRFEVHPELRTLNSEPLENHVSTILGVHLEGPFLNPSRCGALDASSFLKPDEAVLKELTEDFADMVIIITVAPELGGSLKLIEQARDMGINVSMGHSDATFNEAEEGFNRGAEGITHIFNAMRSIHHREPGIAGFGLLNRDIYIEVIADPHHLHPNTLELIFRVKNPERIVIISDSTKYTLNPLSSTGNRFKIEGSRLKVDKLKTAPPSTAGLLRGGIMTVTESAHRLIDMGFDEETVLKCISENPAAYVET